MAFITLDDRTGRQEVAIFSDQYRINKDLLQKDNLVIIEGEVSVDHFSGGYKMRCMEVSSLDQKRQSKAKCLKIVVASNELNTNFSNSLMNLIKPHQSEAGCPVQIMYERDESSVMLRLGVEWKILPKQALLDALKGMSGVEEVLVGY